MTRDRKTAVVFIHGQGLHRPMAAARELARTALENDEKAGVVSRAEITDTDVGVYETGRVSVTHTAGEGRRTTDFIEFYWSHLKSGNRLSDVWLWFRNLIRKPPAETPGPIKPIRQMFINLAEVFAIFLAAFALLTASVLVRQQIAPNAAPLTGESVRDSIANLRTRFDMPPEVRIGNKPNDPGSGGRTRDEETFGTSGSTGTVPDVDVLTGDGPLYAIFDDRDETQFLRSEPFLQPGTTGAPPESALDASQSPSPSVWNLRVGTETPINWAPLAKVYEGDVTMAQSSTGKLAIADTIERTIWEYTGGPVEPDALSGGEAPPLAQVTETTPGRRGTPSETEWIVRLVYDPCDNLIVVGDEGWGGIWNRQAGAWVDNKGASDELIDAVESYGRFYQLSDYRRYDGQRYDGPAILRVREGGLELRAYDCSAAQMGPVLAVADLPPKSSTTESGIALASTALAADGGRLAAGTDDGKIIVWTRGATGHDERVVFGEEVHEASPVSALAFDPSGNLYSGDHNSRLVRWSLPSAGSPPKYVAENIDDRPGNEYYQRIIPIDDFIATVDDERGLLFWTKNGDAWDLSDDPPEVGVTRSVLFARVKNANPGRSSAFLRLESKYTASEREFEAKARRNPLNEDSVIAAPPNGASACDKARARPLDAGSPRVALLCNFAVTRAVDGGPGNSWVPQGDAYVFRTPESVNAEVTLLSENLGGLCGDSVGDWKVGARTKRDLQRACYTPRPLFLLNNLVARQEWETFARSATKPADTDLVARVGKTVETLQALEASYPDSVAYSQLAATRSGDKFENQVAAAIVRATKSGETETAWLEIREEGAETSNVAAETLRCRLPLTGGEQPTSLALAPSGNDRKLVQVAISTTANRILFLDRFDVADLVKRRDLQTAEQPFVRDYVESHLPCEYFPMTSSKFSTSTPISMAFSDDGNDLFVLDKNLTLYQYNPRSFAAPGRTWDKAGWGIAPLSVRTHKFQFEEAGRTCPVACQWYEWLTQRDLAKLLSEPLSQSGLALGSGEGMLRATMLSPSCDGLIRGCGDDASASAGSQPSGDGEADSRGGPPVGAQPGTASAVPKPAQLPDIAAKAYSNFSVEFLSGDDLMVSAPGGIILYRVDRLNGRLRIRDARWYNVSVEEGGSPVPAVVLAGVRLASDPRLLPPGWRDAPALTEASAPVALIKRSQQRLRLSQERDQPAEILDLVDAPQYPTVHHGLHVLLVVVAPALIFATIIGTLLWRNGSVAPSMPAARSPLAGAARTLIELGLPLVLVVGGVVAALAAFGLLSIFDTDLAGLDLIKAADDLVRKGFSRDLLLGAGLLAICMALFGLTSLVRALLGLVRRQKVLPGRAGAMVPVIIQWLTNVTIFAVLPIFAVFHVLSTLADPRFGYEILQIDLLFAMALLALLCVWHRKLLTALVLGLLALPFTVTGMVGLLVVGAALPEGTMFHGVNTLFLAILGYLLAALVVTVARPAMRGRRNVILAVILLLALIVGAASWGGVLSPLADSTYLSWAIGALGGLLVVSVLVAMASRSFLVPIMADSARYLSERPKDVAQARRIREHGIRLLEGLHASGRYDRIVVVAHSLGSIVGLDVISRFWARRTDRMTEQQSEACAQAQVATDRAYRDLVSALQQARRRLAEHFGRPGARSDDKGSASATPALSALLRELAGDLNLLIAVAPQKYRGSMREAARMIPMTGLGAVRRFADKAREWVDAGPDDGADDPRRSHVRQILGELDAALAARDAIRSARRQAADVLAEPGRHGGEEAVWLISDIVTIGSPLTYGDYLLGRERYDSYPENTSMAAVPAEVGAAGSVRDVASFLPAAWTNLFFPARKIVFGDVVAGPVWQHFGAAVEDCALVDRPNNKGFAHNEYWKDCFEERDGKKGPQEHVSALRTCLGLR